MLWLVCEGLDEAHFIIFAIKSNKASKASGVTLQEVRVKCKADKVRTHFSACIMSMSVMSSIGISDRNMSTTKMQEVTEMSPPLLQRHFLPGRVSIGL
jgi:hypothetical protein